MFFYVFLFAINCCLDEQVCVKVQIERLSVVVDSKSKLASFENNIFVQSDYQPCFIKLKTSIFFGEFGYI